MGTIDKLVVTIRCEACNETETNLACGRGSGWGGSTWERLDSFEKFDAVVEHSDRMGP